MSNLQALKLRVSEPCFKGWVGSVTPERIERSEELLQQLATALTALGETSAESDARQLVDACIRAFNVLDDDGWINTIEREDIYEAICQLVELAGFECDEDWFEEREW